ncbi:MAG: hypothetical protein BWY72_01235 [Bacteroidetes bacterium ADurb.Bin416]|nr:MAG: hypothetical protein BWY72_01235 [Bacteroidetes bacterium ADurb.Bin416]
MIQQVFQFGDLPDVVLVAKEEILSIGLSCRLFKILIDTLGLRVLRNDKAGILGRCLLKEFVGAIRGLVIDGNYLKMSVSLVDD